MIKLLLGIAFLLVGIYLIVKSFLIKKNGILLDGTINRYQKEEGHNFPMVHYTYNGEEFDMTASVAHKKPKYSAGDSVKIYRLEKENYVVIDGENAELKNGICITLAGVAIIVLMVLKTMGI